MSTRSENRFRNVLSGPHARPEYWDDLESRHRDHRRTARNLLIAAGVVVVAAVAFSTDLLAVLALIVPLLLVQLFMMRVSRSR